MTRHKGESDWAFCSTLESCTRYEPAGGSTQDRAIQQDTNRDDRGSDASCPGSAFTGVGGRHDGVRCVWCLRGTCVQLSVAELSAHDSGADLD